MIKGFITYRSVHSDHFLNHYLRWETAITRKANTMIINERRENLKQRDLSDIQILQGKVSQKGASSE